MKNPWVIVGIIMVILFGGAMWYSDTANSNNNEGVEIINHMKGSGEARIQLVEYSDFQCPACAAFQPILDQVIESHGDSISFEYKHFPLPIHSFALQAAVAAEAAGQQGKFFEFHDALFENQTEWSNSSTPNASFLSYADELGLDMDLFKRHMNSSLLKDKVKQNTQEGRDLAVTGTPTFFLNGERMQINTYEDFVNQVNQAINPNVTFGEASATTSASEPVTFGI